MTVLGNFRADTKLWSCLCAHYYEAFQEHFLKVQFYDRHYKSNLWKNIKVFV